MKFSISDTEQPHYCQEVHDQAVLGSQMFGVKENFTFLEYMFVGPCNNLIT